MKPRVKIQVILVPFDPDSEEHVERLYQQRVACGWNKEKVETWRTMQREGKIGLHWVTVPSTSPALPKLLTQHTNAYPSELLPLRDTAATVFSSPREPSPEFPSFHPFGHLSIDAWHTSPHLANQSLGIYSISSLYISRALHNSGLGRGAMIAAEEMAAAPPLCGKEMALITAAREYDRNEDMYKAFGQELPAVVNQDWYERMGYVKFRENEVGWIEVDPQGREWPFWIVYLKKRLT